ncbi:MAG TPA: tripartite tricarboxylate transporter substrate-binding protein [Burkholderiales bacterium]|nr:tripartite tricarboxylate transporter substrate-binding protein [Burkholderiales bacterium]
MRYRLFSVCGACVLVASGGAAHAQNFSGGSAQGFPAKPIRLISPAPGASGDFSARVIAQGLTAQLGQPVIVDNRAGYGAVDAVTKAAPDGYTLLIYGSTLWIVPLLENASWDAQRDFAPVALLNSTPSTVVVHPSLPVHSVKALIAFARARPGELNYGSSPAGSSQHLASELFKSMAGLNIVNVPYKSSGAAQIGLLGGEVHMMFPPVGSIAPHVKAGRVRLLAVASAQPSAFLPGVPTVGGSGLPGYEFATVVALFAPAGTPEILITRINQEVSRVLSRPDVRQRFLNEGLETGGGPPEQLAITMRTETVRFSKLIKDAGIRIR